MVTRLTRSLGSAGVLGALVGVALTPGAAPTLRAPGHAPATARQVPRRSAALVAVVIRGNVYVIRADGGVRRRLTGGGQAMMPQLAPTQRWVAYFDTSRSHKGPTGYLTAADVAVVSVAGVRALRLTAAPTADLGTLSWAPDGRRLAFYAGPAIVICNLATKRCASALRRRDGLRWDSTTSIAWTPDGDRIAAALPSTSTTYSHTMRVVIGTLAPHRATTIAIHVPPGALGRPIPPGSYPSGQGLTWAPDGHRLIVATLGEGEGPPNVTGLWQVPDSGGMARLLLGTLAGVRDESYPDGSPLHQPTRFLFSPDGMYLAIDPDDRLWVSHANGGHGRFFDLHLARDCVMAQVAWLADSAGLADVVVCNLPNHNAVTSTLYSRLLTGAPPRLLAHVYSAYSANQGDLQLAPSYRCVDCGY